MRKESYFVLIVKKHHLDSYNHANYLSFLKFYQQSHQKYLKKCDLNFKKLEESYGLRTVVRFLEVEYLGQLFEGDKIVVKTSVKLGSTSLTYNHSMWKGNKQVSNSKMVVVFINKKDNPAEIPRDIKERLI